MSEQDLTREQASALLDILTHYETYAEVEGFKRPDAVTSYGWPFASVTRAPGGGSGASTPTPLLGLTARSKTPTASGLSTPTGLFGLTPRCKTPVSGSGKEDKASSALDKVDKSSSGSGKEDKKAEDDAGAKRDEARAKTPVSFLFGREEKKKTEDDTRVKTSLSFFWWREDKKMEGDDDDDDEEEAVESTSPLLQMLLTRLVLPFPGVKELPREFWSTKVQGILAKFGEAELSESYDKGALGTRRMLATGASSVIEMLARGALGGVEDSRTATTTSTTATTTSSTHTATAKRLMQDYDLSKAEELERAWEACVQEWAHGELLEEIFTRFSETDDVEGHSPGVKAVVEYAIIHLATMLHHILIVSPEGRYLIKLMEGINNLIPYKMMKQTLRVGNAATMINGMMRLLLMKLSVTSLANWVGLTANADDGMNLLQRIIWVVLSLDASDFKKRADKVERRAREDRPADEALQAIREHVGGSRSEHEAARQASLDKSQSIVAAILAAKIPTGTGGSCMTRGQHTQCLEYYSALLSARDRECIISVLCRQAPDLLTQIIKDLMAAYDPVIRSVHSRIDLREHLESLQQFVSDLISVSKPRPRAGTGQQQEGDQETKEEEASVDDYVRLLRERRGLLYKWLHAVGRECPDVWGEMRTWAKAVAVEFRQRRDMRACLGRLCASLDADARREVLAAADAHAAYTREVAARSRQRLQRIVDGSGRTVEGPGVYLSRWQGLLDETRITPEEERGPLRRGRGVRQATTVGKEGLGGGMTGGEPEQVAESARPEAPDVSVVMERLGAGFRVMVRESFSPRETSVGAHETQ